MTKGAKGRGDAAPPKLSEFLNSLRLDYERTGNPVFVWKALIAVDGLWGMERAKAKAVAPDLPLPPVTLPDWCWRHLVHKARLIEIFSMLDGGWEETKNETLAEFEPLVKSGNEGAEFFLEAVEILDRALPKVELKAMEITRKLPQILGFVDGAHSNAFLDYWRDERKKSVARAWGEAERKGMGAKEILAAVSEMTGIFDEPTIRRYVKEAQGKALPRRRSKKPKAPKAKKD